MDTIKSKAEPINYGLSFLQNKIPKIVTNVKKVSETVMKTVQ